MTTSLTISGPRTDNQIDPIKQRLIAHLSEKYSPLSSHLLIKDYKDQKQTLLYYQLRDSRFQDSLESHFSEAVAVSFDGMQWSSRAHTTHIN